MAQPQEVLGVLGPIGQPGPGLARIEDLEPLAAQALQDLDGGDVGIPRAAAIPAPDSDCIVRPSFSLVNFFLRLENA